MFPLYVEIDGGHYFPKKKKTKSTGTNQQCEIFTWGRGLIATKRCYCTSKTYANQGPEKLNLIVKPHQIYFTAA